MLFELRGWLQESGSVTITGGEPFDQRDALKELLLGLRQMGVDSILVYTGFEYEEIENVVSQWEGLIDVLISGPYKENQTDLLPLRGSDNQRLHLLTETGKKEFSDIKADSNTLDVMFDNEGAVWFCGIPKKGFVAKLENSFKKNGHDVFLTAHRHREV